MRFRRPELFMVFFSGRYVDQCITKEEKVDALSKNAIIAAIDEKAVMKNGKKRLACAAAFSIAVVNDITPREIGKICDEEGIVIGACQLGCFP